MRQTVSELGAFAAGEELGLVAELEVGLELGLELDAELQPAIASAPTAARAAAAVILCRTAGVLLARQQFGV
jgi:hypothetical protein